MYLVVFAWGSESTYTLKRTLHGAVRKVHDLAAEFELDIVPGGTGKISKQAREWADAVGTSATPDPHDSATDHHRTSVYIKVLDVEDDSRPLVGAGNPLFVAPPEAQD